MVKTSFVSAACGLVVVGVACATGGQFTLAQDKPNSTEFLSRIAVASPLSVASGTTTKIQIRGWKIDQATEVKLSLPDATVKILKKEKAGIPNGQDAKQIGDEQIEIEVTIPDNVAAGNDSQEFELAVVSPGLTSKPYQLAFTGKQPDIVEKEPNDGFSKAQTIELPIVIQGTVEKDRDVDVFSFTAEKGKRLHAKIIARSRGSALDSLLTLFDARGNVVGSNDDVETTNADAELSLVLPTSGVYRLVLQDALDHGGPAHPYRLQVRLDDAAP